jgi:hypothetical protein
MQLVLFTDMVFFAANCSNENFQYYGIEHHHIILEEFIIHSPITKSMDVDDAT